jgi:Co/Zn/Cd efflux system component
MSDRETDCECSKLKASRNVRILAVAVALFVMITSAQFYASFAAHSTSLLIDCASMLCDIMSYLGNLIGEISRQSDVTHRTAETRLLVASGFSILALTAITLWGFADAVSELVHPAAGGDDDLNPYIVLGFGVGGIVVDLAALAAFYCLGFSPPAPSELLSVTNAAPPDASELGVSARINMCAALSHVLADTLRSTATTVLALVVIFAKVHSSKADSITALVIMTTILAGSGSVVVGWARRVRACCASTAVEADDDQRMNVGASANDYDGTVEAADIQMVALNFVVDVAVAAVAAANRDANDGIAPSDRQ